MHTNHHDIDKPMNRSGFFYVLATVGLLLFCTLPLQAQQDGAQDNLLPEIDPQDIEIRSEFTARFPGLRRQPILGFNPEPRVYQVAANRQPFMETQEEVVANLPISDLSRPAAPAYQELHYEPNANLFARLGVGSFISPEAEAWGIKNFSEESYVGGQLDYHSTNGHLDTENSSFRFFNVDGEYATKLNQNTALKISGGAENSFNRMFELDNRTSLPLQVPAGPRKKYAGFHGALSLNSHKNSVAGWDADAGVRWFDMTMNAEDIGGSATESLFHASLHKEWPGEKLHETMAVNASARGGSYALDDPNSQTDSQNWMTLQAGAEYHRLLDYSTQLTGQAGLAYASNPADDALYPYFLFKAKHWIQDDLTLTGTLSGDPRLHTIEQLHSLNRFLNHQTQLRHTYTVEGSGQVGFQYLEGSSIYAKVSYMGGQQYAYFGRAPLPVNIAGPGSTPDGYYSVNYMDANRLKGEMGATHQLVPEKLWIDINAYVQKPKLDDGRDIPFEERWGVNSGVSAKLLDRFRFEVWANYISKRKTADENPVEGFFLLGGQLDVQITERIGAYAKMANLLSQEYEIWEGYQERPFQAYGGITVKLD